ncbi:Card1-like endonuclease domain-containing protein [Thiocapsa sp.]|uniref:Card1-like endonuclease domain-containing protein n=1 Tax=Thiocapsa sp. TaxID=2024551 RepID=UPI002C0E89F4|nr:DUF1887 family CARF protein [Thiocapsa sp.]HSO81785.1 DUF1887 family CARF protein [Thiocapsa sp.]
MSAHTHLYLVSAQATPNLTPALDPAVAPKRVLLLVSPDMRVRAGWLESVLKPRGIRVERCEIRDAWDVEHVQQQVLALLEREQSLAAAGDIALNATGGTKPMSIAAYEVFRAADLPIFYIHPEHDRLIWMHPAGRPVVDLANRVKLDAFLQAHGARVQSAATDAIPESRRELTDWLVAQSHRLAQPLGTLNWLAMKAKGTLRSPILDPQQRRDMALGDLIGRCSGTGLLSVVSGQLRFPSEAARFYVNGGWLEEHVYAVFWELRREERRIQDLARSLELYRQDPRGAEVHNEIDVACLAENRLYLVECKTKAWKGGDGPGSEALYRLDALADLLGGLQGRAMLVSYLDLPAHVRRRAEDLRIHVCAGARLPELRGEISRWFP